MTKTVLKTIEIDTREIEITVEENGDFVARVDGEWYRAPSLKLLTEKLRKMIRSQGRIAVPVTQISSGHHDEPVITQITLVGVHAGNGNTLYKEDGETGVDQLRWSRDEIYRRLTEAEIAQCHALHEEVRVAKTALEAWLDARRVNDKELMQQAQKELMEKGTL